MLLETRMHAMAQFVIRTVARCMRINTRQMEAQNY